jgi:hypothetical protein
MFAAEPSLNLDKGNALQSKVDDALIITIFIKNATNAAAPSRGIHKGRSGKSSLRLLLAHLNDFDVFMKSFALSQKMRDFFSSAGGLESLVCHCSETFS